jgi:hypothetical protein
MVLGSGVLRAREAHAGFSFDQDNQPIGQVARFLDVSFRFSPFSFPMVRQSSVARSRCGQDVAILTSPETVVNP